VATDREALMVARYAPPRPTWRNPRAALAVVCLAAALAASPRGARAQREATAPARGDSITIHLLDVDVRTAVQALAVYLDRPVILGAVQSARVSVETPHPVARGDVARLLRSVLASQSLDLVVDSAGGAYRVQQKEPPKPTPLVQPAPFNPSFGAPPQGGPLELFVIHLRHARANDVSATVNALLGRASALGELGARGGTLSRELQGQQVPPGLPSGSAPPGAVPIVGGRGATLTSEMTIVPDPRANSLLIRATRADFALIQTAVQEIDVRPLQVLIEVLIAEVRKDRSLDFGVDVSVPSARVPHTANTVVEGTNTGGGLGDFVVKVMGIGNDLDATATLRAAAERGDATIVSRPVLLAANNEEAEINVGSQRPFVQVARVLPTDNAARDQVVQYRDVGTRLRVLPTISADGYVMLQVAQEINAATAEQAYGAPVISTRSVETRLLIKDGQTIVLGGLTDQQNEHRQGGIPVLADIPWIGGLFGHLSRQVSDTELFLFLTARVIRGDDDAERLTNPLRTRAEKVH
jgi:type II secretory pathway component GspD/PulD (secretin)